MVVVAWNTMQRHTEPLQRATMASKYGLHGAFKEKSPRPISSPQKGDRFHESCFRIEDWLGVDYFDRRLLL